VVCKVVGGVLPSVFNNLVMFLVCQPYLFKFPAIDPSKPRAMNFLRALPVRGLPHPWQFQDSSFMAAGWPESQGLPLILN
ncbi:hypothetical protein A2U01_0014114, partial [Trifolium medium]|nr:hypothetical protein [Trifolium medium]